MQVLIIIAQLREGYSDCADPPLLGPDDLSTLSPVAPNQMFHRVAMISGGVSQGKLLVLPCTRRMNQFGAKA